MTEPELSYIDLGHPQLWALSRCGQPVAAWRYAGPMRCNLARGHAGDCDNRPENRPEARPWERVR